MSFTPSPIMSYVSMQRIPGDWQVATHLLAKTSQFNTAICTQNGRTLGDTSFLLLITGFPFCCSRTLANLDQSNFTICGSIENFFSCKETTSLVFEKALFILCYWNWRNERCHFLLASVFIVELQDWWRAWYFNIISKIRSLENSHKSATK